MKDNLQVSSVVLKDFVNEGPVPLEAFELQQATLHVKEELKDGAVLVELLWLSVDPYMRSRMIDLKEHYLGGSFKPGQPLTSGCVGIIRGTKNASFSEGDVVVGMMPWSSHFVLNEEALTQQKLDKVDKSLLSKVPLSYFLGVLGMTGMTAYASLKKIAEPKQGEVALVSSAAGAVGQVVGQLLKHVYGCKVIGSAGSDDKVKLLQDLGFDYAFNYKTHSKNDALAEAAPDGIDIYFENVGGAVLDKVLEVARPHARIVACGMISQYDLPDADKYGVKNLFMVVTKRIKMQGFLVGDYYAELGEEFAQNMAQYVQDGKVKAVEHVTQGLENAGAAFVELMKGGNVGKAVVQVAKDDPFPAKN